MTVTRYSQMTPYVTKDGSVIRELMHPQITGGSRNQSLAEAVVLPGQATHLHKHRTSEELYFITRGEGRMTLGGRRFEVRTGDTVCIPPGTAHAIENTGAADLVILCSCAPAYSHGDTELISG